MKHLLTHTMLSTGMCLSIGVMLLVMLPLVNVISSQITVIGTPLCIVLYLQLHQYGFLK